MVEAHSSPKELERVRNATLHKHTDFARHAMYSLPVVESRVVFWSILKSIQNDNPFGEVLISVSDFADLCGVARGGQYNALKRVTDNLHKRVVRYVHKTPNGDTSSVKTMNWVKSSEYLTKEGVIRIVLNDDLKEYFIADEYTKVKYKYILKFLAQHSERLYSLLRSFAYKDKPADFRLEDLRARLDVGEKTYPNFYDFKRRILDPAVEDINNFTDIYVTYTEIKGYKKKVVALEFDIQMQEVPRLEQSNSEEQVWTEENKAALEEALLEGGTLVPVVDTEDKIEADHVQLSLE